MRSIRRAKIGALTLEAVKERAEAEGLSYGEYMTRYYWS
jgi:predicted DNA binding CopG/RHH family protein